MTSEEILSFFYDKIDFKKGKFGWESKLDLNFYKGKVSYSRGTCPNAEYFHEKSFIGFKYALTQS